MNHIQHTQSGKLHLYSPMFVDTWPHQYVVLLQIGSTRWRLYFQHYDIPSLELRDPNMFLHDNTPVHRTSSIKIWFAKVGVAQLKWSTQNPDLKLTEHLYELDADCISTWPHLCSCGWVNTTSHSQAPKSSRTPCQKSEGYYDRRPSHIWVWWSVVHKHLDK